MARMETRFEGLAAMDKKYRKIQFSVLSGLPTLMKNAAKHTIVLSIQNAIDDQGITWRGNLKSAIAVMAEKEGSGVRFSIFIDEKIAPYGDYIEKGRPAENLSRGELDRLYLWVKSKLGIPDPKAFFVTWAIAQKIENDGLKDGNTLPNPFFEKAFQSARPAWLKAIQEELNLFVSRLQ